MTRIALFLFLFVFCLLPFQGLITAPALAITAEEQLADPDLELRARGLSKQLRCLVCQNQSIDDSDADLAKDLRAEVRAQILAGADDKTILANLQERYGDYVLLKPPVGLSTTLLWATPILALIIGASLILL
ncbi:MAG: cytochrome c-type biogenesis protein, partial [Candidatus Puniceispirillaceae bacterium]